jgi:hypothetical protein
MADDSDILGKADALLRRHVPPRATAAEGSDVPVLRELITPGAPSAAPQPSATSPAPAVPPQAAATSGDDFRRELVAEVVRAVHLRLAQDLERRLTQHLVAEVQSSVAATLADLRQDIANAVGDAVAEALARRPDR